ncbi:hypothetical protein P152DRAFT_258258 [Eremomyces bilateralis CBS 781.70]|uniref:Tudor domain-containing protein n=1 Tax=Eremomyces bilateralis CBS 781.70 TaxID=1392243 RepID=A0A6G1FQA8_9PEZI|nr:uncharacterized protein P152DRAFT_258258 [Eremomyces bilateralis CBS 781.70]KAF1808015.1 hypothetical protein P152DRAFT_258258 [Eremomyces bilateralis CBS 781.70]
MASQIATREAEIKEYEEQLETVLSALQGDSESAELNTLKDELNQILALQRDEVAELKATAASEPAKPPSSKDKWTRDPGPDVSHRKPDTPHPTDQPSPAITYAVNDPVLAQWTSGDRKFYPARITSITGSAAAPVYTVVFKSYNNTETARAHELKPLPTAHAGRKRKAEEAALPADNANVISAAAAIDPELAKEARKVKARKELEASKSKWQDFNAKGKFGKGKRKESMFRTGEGVNARVGFTGSGQAMRKDPSRSRHIHEYGEDEY